MLTVTEASAKHRLNQCLKSLTGLQGLIRSRFCIRGAYSLLGTVYEVGKLDNGQ